MVAGHNTGFTGTSSSSRRSGTPRYRPPALQCACRGAPSSRLSQKRATTLTSTPLLDLQTCSHLSPFRAWCTVNHRVLRSTCVGAIAARAHRTAFAHGIYRVRSGRYFLPRCPRAHFCISGSTHALTPMPPFVSLATVGFFACLSAVARRRRQVGLPPLRPRAFHRPGDCPILRPRAGLPLTRACDSPFAMSFGATLRTRFPSSSRHAVGCCCLRRDPSSALRAFSRLWSDISMLPNTHAA